MTTIRETVKRALQMAKVVALGDDPTADEAQAGLEVLQSYYLRLCDTALGPVQVTYYEDDVEAEEGERIQSTGDITLPTLIDGYRLPHDLAAIQLNEGSGWEHHISDRGTWVQIDGLTLNSDAPFASRNPEGLAALLATELADMFGGEISPSIEIKARRFRTQMQPVNLTPNEYF